MKNDWPAILKESVKAESPNLLANLRGDWPDYDAAMESSIRAVMETLSKNEKTLYETAEDSFLDRWEDEPEKIEEETFRCLQKIIDGFDKVLQGF